MIRELRNLPAPAKLNLFLHVVGRRADGYHLLESAFALIGMHDDLDLVLRDDGEIRMRNPAPGVPPDQDLCIRAARLLASASGTHWGVEISLRKRIPMGGGLGGGSSDAATVLIGLNRLWQLDWPRERLLALAPQLGADVPFFVFGCDAFVRGIGERLMALPLAMTSNRHYVVVTPSVSVATAAVFAEAELTRDTKPLKITGFSRAGKLAESSATSAKSARGEPAFTDRPVAAARVYRLAEENALKRACQAGKNDLQAVVRARVREVEQALVVLSRAVAELGEPPESVRMSGSGSCVFADFGAAGRAAKVARRTRSLAERQLRVWCGPGLIEHPLRGLATDEV